MFANITMFPKFLNPIPCSIYKKRGYKISIELLFQSNLYPHKTSTEPFFYLCLMRTKLLVASVVRSE